MTSAPFHSDNHHAVAERRLISSAAFTILLLIGVAILVLLIGVPIGVWLKSIKMQREGDAAPCNGSMMVQIAFQTRAILARFRESVTATILARFHELVTA